MPSLPLLLQPVLLLWRQPVALPEICNGVENVHDVCLKFAMEGLGGSDATFSRTSQGPNTIFLNQYSQKGSPILFVPVILIILFRNVVRKHRLPPYVYATGHNCRYHST